MVRQARDAVPRLRDDLCILIFFVSNKYRYFLALRALRPRPANAGSAPTSRECGVRAKYIPIIRNCGTHTNPAVAGHGHEEKTPPLPVGLLFSPAMYGQRQNRLVNIVGMHLKGAKPCQPSATRWVSPSTHTTQP
jgi:hypothetical protein